MRLLFCLLQHQIYMQILLNLSMDIHGNLFIILIINKMSILDTLLLYSHKRSALSLDILSPTSTQQLPARPWITQMLSVENKSSPQTIRSFSMDNLNDKRQLNQSGNICWRNREKKRQNSLQMRQKIISLEMGLEKRIYKRYNEFWTIFSMTVSKESNISVQKREKPIEIIKNNKVLKGIQDKEIPKCKEGRNCRDKSSVDTQNYSCMQKIETILPSKPIRFNRMPFNKAISAISSSSHPINSQNLSPSIPTLPFVRLMPSSLQNSQPEISDFPFLNYLTFNQFQDTGATKTTISLSEQTIDSMQTQKIQADKLLEQGNKLFNKEKVKEKKTQQILKRQDDSSKYSFEERLQRLERRVLGTSKVYRVKSEKNMGRQIGRSEKKGIWDKYRPASVERIMNEDAKDKNRESEKTHKKGHSVSQIQNVWMIECRKNGESRKQKEQKMREVMRQMEKGRGTFVGRLSIYGDAYRLHRN